VVEKEIVHGEMFAQICMTHTTKPGEAARHAVIACGKNDDIIPFCS